MPVMELDTTAHPKTETLRKLSQGRLAADEVACLEEHLAYCDACSAALEDMPDDSFVGQLRQAQALRTRDTFVPRPDTTLSDHGPEPAELARHPRYRLIRLLGQGGMGAVYLAEHRHMARPVALKLLNAELVNQSGFLPRFEQEVRTAAKLDHPNIVAGYDADHAGSLHFLVMEYVAGQNLADYMMEKGPLPVSQACEIIRQAAQGLQHAHERGMVHRDIKPHNLMLTPSGQVKVLDFGLARFSDEPVSSSTDEPGRLKAHLTSAGAVMGSADYIAPEQARDARLADCRSDIYSLGCTFYHLLANQPPFPEGAAPEKLKRHSTDAPRLLTEVRTDTPRELAKIVAKMMAKRPDERYQSAAVVGEALTPFTVDKVRKRWAPRTKAAVATALLLVSSALAAGVVRLSEGNREFVIETDDPTVEIVVKGEQIVRIVDPKTGKAYLLNRKDLTLSLADDPDGLAVTLDDERPLVLKRQGERIATLRTQTLPRVNEANAAKEDAKEKGDFWTNKARYELAMKEMANKNYKQAKELLKDRLAPQGPLPLDQVTHELSIFKLAELHYLSKDYDKAALYFEEACQRYPKNRGVLTARGRLAHCYKKLADQALRKMLASTDDQARTGFQSERRNWLEQGSAAFEMLAEELEFKQRETSLTEKEVPLLRDALFGVADMRFSMNDFAEAIRRYEDIQDRYRKQVEGLIACQRIWKCVGLMDDNAEQRIRVRTTMAESLKKFKADLETMWAEGPAFQGANGVYTKKNWLVWARWVDEQFNRPTSFFEPETQIGPPE